MRSHVPACPVIICWTNRRSFLGLPLLHQQGMQWRSKEDLLPHSGIRQAPNPEMRTQETTHHSATLVPTHRQPIEHDLRRNESEGKTQYFHPTTLLPDASSCSQKAHCPPVLLIPELLHKGATAEAASAQVHPNVAAVKQRRAHLLLPDLQGECQCGLSAIPPRHGWEKHLWQEPLASNWSASNDQCQRPSPTRQCQRKRRSAVPSLPNLAIDQQIQHQPYRQLQQNAGDLLWVPGPGWIWRESVTLAWICPELPTCGSSFQVLSRNSRVEAEVPSPSVPGVLCKFSDWHLLEVRPRTCVIHPACLPRTKPGKRGPSMVWATYKAAKTTTHLWCFPCRAAWCAMGPDSLMDVFIRLKSLWRSVLYLLNFAFIWICWFFS